MISVYEGNAWDVLSSLPSGMFAAIVTDPPYETDLARAKGWDSTGIAHDPEFWKEALRVLVPGARAFVFSAGRTYHKLALAMERAGFEIQEPLGWVDPGAFPPGRDVALSVDNALGATRETVVRLRQRGAGSCNAPHHQAVASGKNEDVNRWAEMLPATPEAAAWDGWNTTIRSALQPIAHGRKPLLKNVATTALEGGVPGLNVRACPTDGGKWPSSVLVSEDGAKLLSAQAGEDVSRQYSVFYHARNATWLDEDGSRIEHDTPKPLPVMRWLVRLAVPTGMSVLDLFAGSGSTGVAAAQEQRGAVLIEANPKYVQVSINRCQKEGETVALTKILTVFYAHPANVENVEELGRTLLTEMGRKLKASKPAAPGVTTHLRVILGRDDHGRNFQGDWDRWADGVVSRQDSVSGKMVYGAFVVPTGRLGRATARIVTSALRSKRPVFRWDGGSVFERVKKVVCLDADDWRSGWGTE